jgi:phage/plasmid-like protein (TIGR03299 family)
MSDNIFGQRYGDSRGPAWHGLGTVFTKSVTPVQAIQLTGNDFKVEKFPLSAEINGKMYSTPKYGLFREPVKDDNDFTYFGTVGADYEVVQNIEIAEIIEPLAKLWQLETVGSLGKGQTLFIVLDGGEFEIHGDHLNQYFTVSDVKDGGHCLRIDTTPVRTVCGNTMRMALAQATVTLALNHARDPKKKLDAISTTIEKMQHSNGVVMDLLESLTKKKLSKEYMVELINTLYPVPEVTKYVDPVTGDPNYVRRIINWKERVEATQSALVDLYNRFNDEQSKFANTGYAFYNAVVELEDYKSGRNWAQSAMFGNRAHTKEKAFDLVLNLK